MPKTFVLSVVACSLALAQTQPATQMPQSVAGVVRLNRAPVSNEVLKVKLPRPVEKTLANGIKLLVLENHRGPSINFRMSLPAASSLRDPAGVPGVADATAALIRSGTKTKNSREIAEALADLGSQISFNSNQEETLISFSTLPENLDATLALLADMLLNPTFPSEELNQWKIRQSSNLELAKSQPAFLANDVLSKLLYPSDARQFTHPTADSLKAITRDMVVEHFKKYYVPSGEFAGIYGDITPDAAVSKLNKALEAWKGGPAEHVSLPKPAPIAEKKVFLIDRYGAVQTLLVLANHAIDRKSPDYVECQVMNRILGSGPSSRLFRVVREQKGYTYGIVSAFSATPLLNHFTANSSVRSEVTEEALTEILKQFAGIRETAVPADELADAKSAIVSGFVLGLESSAGVMGRWLDQRQNGLPEDYWDTFSQKVMAVTAEDVQRVAKKYVPLDNVQIIAVGDPSRIGAGLKKFGPLEEIKAEEPNVGIR